MLHNGIGKSAYRFAKKSNKPAAKGKKIIHQRTAVLQFKILIHAIFKYVINIILLGNDVKFKMIDN